MNHCHPDRLTVYLNQEPALGVGSIAAAAAISEEQDTA